MPRRLGLLLVLCALAASSSGAQTMSLVRDLNTGINLFGNSYPEQLLAAGGKVFFVADWNGAAGVWVSDGTPAGTVLLLEQPAVLLGNLGRTVFWISAGPEEEAGLWRSDGTRTGTAVLAGSGNGIRIVLGETAFFKGRLWFAGCRDAVCSLWSTDGTPEGTAKDVDVAVDGPFDLTAAGSHLFFRVRSAGGQELWATDGAPGNAAPVAELPAVPRAQAAAGDRLFFIPSSDSGELWASDGTRAGTLPVIHSSQPLGNELKPAGSRVYFFASEPAGGNDNDQIWVSDGTVRGTKQVTRFSSGGPFTSSASLAEAGGRLVFLGVDTPGPPRLFATDGRPESTARLPAPVPCPDADCDGLIRTETRLVSVGNRVVFVGATPGNGAELWSTDGKQGPRLVADFCPGRCSGITLSRDPLPWDGGVLFQARTAVSEGGQIWRSDGTPQGTKRLTAVPGGTAYIGPPEGAAALGQTLFFAAYSPPAAGLWATDGNPQSTRLVASGGFGGAADPRDLTRAGDALFFSACTADGQRRLWLTRGTAESTLPIPGEAATKLCDSNDREAMILGAAGGTILFRHSYPGEPEIWRTDGTAAGTFRLGSFFLGQSPEAAALAGRLFFVASPPVSSNKSLWVSDGTVAGTGLFQGFPTDSNNEIANLTVVGNALYFTVEKNGQDTLWISDGTPGGTRPLTTFVQSLFYPARFTLAGSRVFFTGPDGQLWRTDGTPGGTLAVVTDVALRELTAVNGTLYFMTGSFQTQDTVLWKSAGTPAGTVPLHTFPRVPQEPFLEDPPEALTAFAGRLFLVARDADHGAELWTSDGTAGGTRMLRDITPGPGASKPAGLTVAGGRLFFAAGDPYHGREVWQTDGTETGTRLVQDLLPMGSSSRPELFTNVGDRLYFAADDGLTGRELWSLPLGAPAGCQPSATRLCLQGGRFQVEAAWRDFQSRQGAGQAVALTADTGYFWFFDPANIEAVVKILDGGGSNGHFWTFYGALSNVEYSLTVTDTQTGAARRYNNPLGQFASVGDTRSFGPLGAFSRDGETPASTAAPLLPARSGPAATVPCQASASRLCLKNGRFAVEVAWKDFQGNRGVGTAVGLTADTGYFWFFDAANVEVVLKVLDGTATNGHHWVFYGALSNVEYDITVTDTLTGKFKTYRNPSGKFGSLGDTMAF